MRRVVRENVKPDGFYVTCSDGIRAFFPNRQVAGEFTMSHGAKLLQKGYSTGCKMRYVQDADDFDLSGMRRRNKRRR